VVLEDLLILSPKFGSKVNVNPLAGLTVNCNSAISTSLERTKVLVAKDLHSGNIEITGPKRIESSFDLLEGTEEIRDYDRNSRKFDLRCGALNIASKVPLTSWDDLVKERSKLMYGAWSRQNRACA